MKFRFVFIAALTWLVTGLATFAPDALALCQVPRPRLVCAEYSNSQAVVIAKLSGVREVVDKDGFDGHVYTLETSTRLRGQIDNSFPVWEENSSGRATFGWAVGTTYLLFLSYDEPAHAWTLDGCGNSGRLDRSETTLAAIKSVQSSKIALVEGMASTSTGTTGIPAVTIRATGNGKTFSAKTDQNGRFQIQLPSGHYKLEAARPGRSFEPDPFSYEDPEDLKVTAGSCAQVQFIDAQKQ